MGKIDDELKDLDRILVAISLREGFFLEEASLLKESFFSNSRIEYLIGLGFILKTPYPTVYKLTENGIIFISKGGFKAEMRKSDVERRGNLLNSYLSPLIALASLMISIIAIYLSTSKSDNLKISIDFPNITESQKTELTNNARIDVDLPTNDTSINQKKSH
jgi:hypothetical protein